MSEHPVFHSGELHLQKLSGVNVMADKLSKMMITDYLTEQHQVFFNSLNTLFIASIDEYGKPWASLLIGNTGFIYTPDKTHLNIQAKPFSGDKLAENIIQNKHLGLLGLEHLTRRRNRAAGELTEFDETGISIKINQAFGNCPKYIQARDVKFIDNTNKLTATDTEEFNQMNDACMQTIEQADTFYIASYQPGEDKQGTDISHRGGKPGFVKIISPDTLIFDDYSGNNLFMTLGNIISYPYAGLLFIDYKNNIFWQLQCKAEIIETPDKKHARQVRLMVNQVRKLSPGLNIKWEFIDYSSFLP